MNLLENCTRREQIAFFQFTCKYYTHSLSQKKLSYTLGERAAGLRKQQRKTVRDANITDSDRIFRVKEADATEASRVRPEGKRTVGAIISNELLDEFDPVKLKLVWETGRRMFLLFRSNVGTVVHDSSSAGNN